ncbi:MAG: GNAT family N-acetyltransferase [Chryseolinea sp.]
MNLPSQVLTERLSIQRLKSEDAEEIFYAYASKPEATKFVSWSTHRSINDTKAFLRSADDSWRKGTAYTFSVRLRIDSRMVGSFGVLNDQGKLQVGYVYGPLHWGRGYATEVCLSMIALLRRQPEVYRIQSFVDNENQASAGVLLKSGFIEEAKLPNWFRFINQGNQPKDCIQYRVPLEFSK